jgi:hypothetical protein
VSDEDPERGSRNLLKEWLAPLVQALALLSLLMYGLVRIFYDDFYAKFRVTPEDVGASSAVVISQTAVGVVAVFVSFFAYVLFLIAPLLLIALGFAYFARWARSGAGRRPRGPLFPTWLKSWRVFKVSVGLTLLISVVILIVQMRTGTRNARDCALAGGNVAGVSAFSFPSSVLKYHAQRVKVTWLTKTRPSIGKRLMFLGESSGTSFVYDLDTKRTTRFPSNAAAMTFVKTPTVHCTY